jgi:hypothetical protein
MGTPPKDIPGRLLRKVGDALELESKKYSYTHLDVLVVLESLREAFTEDFLKTHPKDLWMLRRIK